MLKKKTKKEKPAPPSKEDPTKVRLEQMIQKRNSALDLEEYNKFDFWVKYYQDIVDKQDAE